MTRCPSCDAEASAGDRFCSECGTSLAVRRCDSCGAVGGRGKFCASCGTAYGPDPLAGGTRSSVHPVAERRITSVLFGDLVGFTTLAEGRDPEEVRELLGRYFAEARTVVKRYGGTVEKFIGDALMAVWGVPVAHEDDAERAVRAGLELVETITALGEQMGAPGLSMRVGVVTGEVAVTLGATGEGMVAGDAVNTASRVQSVAEPGRVWVDEATRALTATSLTYSNVGTHELKGKAEPLALWQAGAVVAAVGGAQRVDGLEAPLIGRERDLRLVKELFHACDEAGRPSLLVVEGPAGVGKSRLAWEFEKYVDGLSSTVRWHRGRCLSYGEGVAFWALGEAVRGRIGSVEGDSTEVGRERLEAALETFVPDLSERDWIRPRVAALVGATASTASFPRDDLFSAWATFLERVGQGADPVVLLIDDGQYADDGLLDFLDYLMVTARSAIFVLVLARPELLARRPQLGGRRATVIRLDMLGDEAMAAMLDALVDGLPKPVRRELVTRAEGMPLFAVETVRALIDRDLVVARGGSYVVADPDAFDVATIGPPASLQALVAARIDALTPDERRVVTDASVLGASFGVEAMRALAGDVGDLDAVLKSLQRKEILALQTDRLSSEYGQLRFVQSVVRQVALSTQSRRDRKARHLAAATYLEGIDQGELAVVRAQHLVDAVDASAADDADVAELTRQARDLLVEAAVRARALGSPAEAARLYDLALTRTPDAADRARLCTEAAKVNYDAGAFGRTIDLGVEAIGLWRGLGDPIGEAEAAVAWGSAMIDQSLSGAALEALEAHLSAIEDLPRAERARLGLLNNLGRAHHFRGDWARANDYAQRQMRLAESIGDYEQLAMAFRRLAAIAQGSEMPESAIAMVRGGVDLCRRHGFTAELAIGLSNLTTLLGLRDLDGAVDAGREGLAVALRTGAVIELTYSTLNLVLALTNRGDWAERDEILGDETIAPQLDVALILLAVEVWRSQATGAPATLDHPTLASDWESDDESLLGWRFAVQASLAEDAGEIEDASRLFVESLDHISQVSGIEDDFIHVWPRAVRLAIRAGRLEVADELIRRVSEAPVGIQAPAHHAYVAELQGRLAFVRGDDEAAQVRLREGIRLLDAFGARPDAARARHVLGLQLRAQARDTEAEELLEAARAEYRRLGAGVWLAELDAEVPATAR